MVTFLTSYWLMCAAAVLLSLTIAMWPAQGTWRPDAPIKPREEAAIGNAEEGDFLVSFPQVLSQAECDQLLQLLGEERQQEGLVSSNSGPGLKRDTVRIAKLITIEPGDVRFQWLFRRLWVLGHRATSGTSLGALRELEPLNLVSYPAAKKAEAQGHYDWHTDLMPDISMREGRLLSFSIQLSGTEDYQGGALMVGSEQASKRRGAGVVFPSYMAHSVYPVSKGVRHALVGWVRGRVGPSLHLAAEAAHHRAMEDSSWPALAKRGKSSAQAAPLGLRRIYGNHLLQSGRFEDASAVLRRVAQEDPGCPGALNNLAVSEYQQGRVPAAIDPLTWGAGGWA